MELQDGVRGRRSIRAFLDKPVEKEALTRLLETTLWAPSPVNIQPWEVTAVTGEKRDELEARLVERVMAGGGPPEKRYPDDVPADVLRRREALLDGITKVAQESGIDTQKLLFGSYRFYGAPVAVIVSYDKQIGEMAPVGIASFVTTMLLVAHDMGLGTCWLGMPLAYPDVIRETLDIPESQQLEAVVALGYPDPESGINTFRSSRDELDTFVKWVGFD